MRKNHVLCAAVAACALSFASNASAETIYGMTAASSASTSAGVNLVSFDSASPGVVTTIGPFSGMLANHSVREIDFRPATGDLYAISTDAGFNAQVYTVNLATGALTPQGASFLLPGTTNTVTSIDFNPAADRLRIVTRTNQSYRWNPQTNAFVAQDTTVAYDATDPQFGLGMDLIGAAYTNNVAGAPNTTLYAWSYSDDTLLRIGGINGTPSPNLGQGFTVLDPSPTFRTFNAGLDMDVSGTSGICYVTHDDPATGTSMNLYTLNLTTGVETLVGAYPTGTFIPSISAAPAPIPEPTAIALAGIGLFGLGIRRRR